MNKDTLTEETTALILRGQGYDLTIAPEAEERKAALLSSAAEVLAVTSNDESASAQFVSRKLAAMRIEVEKCRKLVKEPVNRIGKLIDKTAADFIASIEADEKRINRLVGQHAAEVARLKAEKEADERRAFEEARAAREAAEAATAAAESTGKISDVIAAKQAEQQRLAALAARMEASAEVAETKVAQGVRFAWDFEIEDLDTVYRVAPDFVTLEIKRAAVIAWLKELESADDNVTGMAASIGIRAFKKPVVSSR
jgi:hypothetical protein